jgi:hypothetical protein
MEACFIGEPTFTQLRPLERASRPDLFNTEYIPPSTLPKGRAITQAVSCWLPTAAARGRTRVWSCGICGGQIGAGAGFLRVLRFPLPIFIPPIALQSSSSIIWGLYNRPVVAAVPSGLSPTPLIIIIIIIIIIPYLMNTGTIC